MEDGDSELIARFLTARTQVIKKFELDLTLPDKGHSGDARWLAHYLWGRWAKPHLTAHLFHSRRYSYEEWLAPPEDHNHLYLLTLDLEDMLKLSASLVRDDIAVYLRGARHNKPLPWEPREDKSTDCWNEPMPLIEMVSTEDDPVAGFQEIHRRRRNGDG